MAAAKVGNKNWRNALHEYVHVHNTLKPHARLGITPFELLVGWKYRGTFPSLWDSKSTDILDRDNVREMDATTKLQSKKYADARRRAKVSDISVGDIVLMAVPKKSKTDPVFSDERFIVLSRDGAKVVVRSDRGVQYTRSVNDLKQAPLFNQDGEEKHDPTTDFNGDDQPINAEENLNNCNPDEMAANPTDKDTVEKHNGEEDSTAKKAKRPIRNTRKPEKFKDMCLYNIFQ